MEERAGTGTGPLTLLLCLTGSELRGFNIKVPLNLKEEEPVLTFSISEELSHTS